MSILNETLKKINLQTFADEGALDVNLLQRRTKVMKTAVFNQIMLEHPEYNNKQICDAMNISPSTMCRIRRDLGAKSPYRYDIPTPKRKTKVSDLDEQNNNNTDSKVKTTQKSDSNINLTIPKKSGRPKRNDVLSNKNIVAGSGDFDSMDINEYINQEKVKI
jgi:ribosomal protein L1